jgi:hypothetical protein
MDSGWAVPTLKPGLSETLAAKLLTMATARASAAAGAGLATSARWMAVGAESPDFMLVRRAFFFAAESAGRSSAARTAMMAITMSSSIRVNARWGGSFISHLVSFLHERLLSILNAKAFSAVL